MTTFISGSTTTDSPPVPKGNNAQYAIPEDLFVVLRPRVSVFQHTTDKYFDVRPAFVADSLYPRLVEQARTWGGPNREELVVKNHASSWAWRLVESETRRGNIVFKVIVNTDWYVDLRLEEFMAAIFRGTPEEGRYTGPASHVWSRGVSQMRLIQVGGQLFNERAAYGVGIKS